MSGAWRRLGIGIAAGVLATAANFVLACDGFYLREEVSGMNKICYYRHLASVAAITIPAHRVCPITVTFAHR